ncbi:hypothetical protein GCM10010448_63770 [Streptomyces glomeratus]|uniref:Uncharacterized protein n=1 Tax=Streptomyces glomeratus TaxID=284452 RepID=A0ABP6M295_9ACTN
MCGMPGHRLFIHGGKMGRRGMRGRAATEAVAPPAGVTAGSGGPLAAVRGRDRAVRADGDLKGGLYATD